MAFINTIPAQGATGAALEMYERQENHWGYVPNYSKVFSHRPEVMARWGRMLAEIRRPVDDRRFELVTFVAAMDAAHIIITDSGGIQEEAPALVKPVLVFRHETERPEAVEAGVAKLVGPDRKAIAENGVRLMTDEAAYKDMAKGVSPYGDGHASERIGDVLRQAFAGS